MNLKARILMVVAVLTPLLAALADDSAPVALTLGQARETALKNHPRITAAELISLASKQVVRESRSAFFPRITGEATAAGTSGANTRYAAGGLNNPLILDREADGVNVSQLITDFGRTANLTAGAKLTSRARAENALATRAQILLAVDSGYFSALEAQSVLEVARQTVKTRQLTYDRVDELGKNKLKSGLDVSFAKVDLDTAKLLVANSRNDLHAAFATLANLLGGRESRDFQLTDEPMPSGNPPDDNQLVELALRDRPDLVELRFERDAAGRFARAEKDLNYPTVSAVGGAGVLPTHDPSMKDNYAAAGINVSVPIFEGMLFSAREKEAELKARAAGENVRDLENNVIRDVRIAAMNVTYAAERLTLTRQLVESANLAFDLAQDKYKVGSSSIVELSQAQLNATEAQIAVARAKYEYQMRNSILNFQTGQTISSGSK